MLEAGVRPSSAEEKAVESEPVASYFARQIDWSRETFGPALRTKGVIDHIRKELVEIEREPQDLSEWIDVVILAMDGFWRHGGKAEDLMPALLAKQRKNMARVWPDWRKMSEDSAIEHDRSHDAHPPRSSLTQSEEEEMVSVPVEPDETMLDAGQEEIAMRQAHGMGIYAADIWDAMIFSRKTAAPGDGSAISASEKD